MHKMQYVQKVGHTGIGNDCNCQYTNYSAQQGVEL